MHLQLTPALMLPSTLQVFDYPTVSAMSAFISSRLPPAPAGQSAPALAAENNSDSDALSSTWGSSDLSGSFLYSSDSGSAASGSRQYQEPRPRRQLKAGGRSSNEAAVHITAAASRSPGGAVARLLQGDARAQDSITTVPHVRCVPSAQHRTHCEGRWFDDCIEHKLSLCLLPMLLLLLQMGHVRGPIHCLHRRRGAACAIWRVPGTGMGALLFPSKLSAEPAKRLDGTDTWHA